MPPIPILPIDRVPHDAVEALLDRAFGTDRHGRTAYRLRTGVEAIPALSFAAVDSAGTLAGTIQCWPVELAGRNAAVPMVLVGPVAVAPERQGSGIGQALMRTALAAADSGIVDGADRLTMIGDPDYYGRFFGFSAAATGGWTLPGPVERHRLLLRGPAPAFPNGRLGPRGTFPSRSEEARRVR